MEALQVPLNAADYLYSIGVKSLVPVAKETNHTRAWFGRLDEMEVFLKLYLSAMTSRGEIDAEISGAGLHPNIVPLRQTAACADGLLLMFHKVEGENLGTSAARIKFLRLPVKERISAVLCVIDALSAVADAGYTITDWYEGNMLYDYAAKQIWLFDWELCRRGDGFDLDVEFNEGSTRLMAPEEYVRGSRLDQRTTVYSVGRYVLLNFPELATELSQALLPAIHPAQSERYAKLRDFQKAVRRVLIQAT